jgi:hypothetical protein
MTWMQCLNMLEWHWCKNVVEGYKSSQPDIKIDVPEPCSRMLSVSFYVFVFNYSNEYVVLREFFLHLPDGSRAY